MTDKRAPTFFLPGRLASRWASYLADVQALTLQGTTEPSRWIGCMEGLWVGVASDGADWLREAGFGDGPVVGGGIPRPQGTLIRADHPVAKLDIEVPAGAFAHFGVDKLDVHPSPLECQRTVVAFPGTNLRMEPATVTLSDRRTNVRVFDLPKLQPGMEMRGVVWATPPRLDDEPKPDTRRPSQGARGPSAPIVVASLIFHVD